MRSVSPSVVSSTSRTTTASSLPSASAAVVRILDSVCAWSSTFCVLTTTIASTTAGVIKRPA